MTIKEIEGLIIIEPDIYTDNRGYFCETYNKNRYLEKGIKVDFVQDNFSKSVKNVFRGLHYQKPPYAQDKLVRVVNGKAIDIAVDIRATSPTFGKYYAVELSPENMRLFFIPKGFAHGFYTLTDDVVFEYKVSNYYNKESEDAINWQDKKINIDWVKIGAKNPIISEKDQNASSLDSKIEELRKLVW